MNNRLQIGSFAGLILLSGSCHLLLDLDSYELDPGICSLNGQRDGRETDVDCGGGACPPCVDQQGCSVGADCESGVCEGGSCIAAACDDKVPNGDETDVDCGGRCPGCGPENACRTNEDCKSSECMEGLCVSTCSDAVKGGSETDVDCGGGAASGCPPCPNGGTCKENTDCKSEICSSSTCVDYHLWSKRFGDASQQDLRDVTVDSASNTILTGFFQGSLDFGGGPLVSAGADDVFLAKFDVNGGYLWSKSFGAADDQRATSVATNKSGDIVMTGSFKNTINLGGGQLAAAGDFDIFVAKWSAIGAHLWSKSFGDPTPQLGYSVAEDDFGGVLVAGTMYGTVNFGGGALTSAGASDAFILKLDSAGNWSWNKRFGDSANQFILSTTIDSSGAIVIAGSFEGSISLGSCNATSAGGYDIFVARLSSTGTCSWLKRFGDGSDQFDVHATTDKNQNIVAVGGFIGTMDFGGGPLTSAGMQDIFVAKLDSSGNYVWSERYGDDKAQGQPRVAVDESGNIAITGAFDGTLDVSGKQLLSAGLADSFIVKLDDSGKSLWSKSFGDAQGTQIGTGVAFGSQGKIVLGGTFTSTIDLGGGQLVSAGGSDAFLTAIRSP